MKDLTIGALVAAGDDLARQLEADGLVLDELEAIDLAGLQLLIALERSDASKGAPRLLGKLPTELVGTLLAEGGFLPAEEGPAMQTDSEALWRKLT